MDATAKDTFPVTRSLAVGPQLQPDGGVHFRVWAAKRHSVDVLLLGIDGGTQGEPIPLEAEDNGYFSILVPQASAGTRYKLRLDGGEAFPDPASHFQPEGPHGPSVVVDHRKFEWTDAKWRGVSIRGQVIYELHIGSFTPRGTYESAKEKLPLLKDLGITIVEIMPLACFPGHFGWGYDGVNLYAPYQHYGSPDDLRGFVNYAHSIGLGVILDVVYNHLGPDGNYITHFSDDFFHRENATEWGDAINFDGENSEPVREFFAGNVEYWIREFHFDGLRFDATQAIHDKSRTHILEEMARRARSAAGNREIILAAENEAQEAKIAKPQERGGYGFDALWNDDFHHTAIAALTGQRSAYYTDYLGTPQEFVSAVKYGYLYQGQYYSWQKTRRGEPTLGMEPPAFVTYIENHDQVSNSLGGKRLHQLTSPARFRAMTALMLLAPGTPLLFQGQEFASTKPFIFFADHNPDLAKLVHKGRAEFLSQFPELNAPEMRARVPDPAKRETLEMCKLDWGEWERNSAVVALHRDLLQLRHTDPAFRMQLLGKVDGAVIGPQAFVLRYFVEAEQDRLLLVNLGTDLNLLHVPEPLLAPPEKRSWQVTWCSEDVRYGGSGFVNPDSDQGWRIRAESATVLAPSQPNNFRTPEHRR
ncbi:MAG TPA: malto-oligosyltrehalose trehalohydrolase [Terriglobales bacterium]|nr:malto-oligosyltrehalose trehalohydrolase [Terriglobales bacterium]